MNFPLPFFSVSRSWAIHFSDSFEENFVLHLDTPSKEITNVLSELPYFCPNKMHPLSVYWKSRNVHLSTQESKQNKENDKYKIEYECTKNKNMSHIHLYIKMFECFNHLYCALFDENNNIWGNLCLKWDEKTNPDSLWSICFPTNIPQNAKIIEF